MGEEPRLHRDESAVPRGLISRARKLAGTSAKISFRLATLGPRTMLGKDSPQQIVQDVYTATAQELLATLGQLKGTAMKIGQLASFVDAGVLPPELRDVYQEILGSLRDAAPPMPPALVGQVFEREFGAAPDELYGSFDDQPAAAASLGQVHFATTRDGREVAVKLQYPGVDQAVRAELSVTSVIKPFLPLLAPGLDADEALAAGRDMVLRELDYEAEARNLAFLADTYDGHPFAWVPRPLPELSTRRVLTMERAYGAAFEEIKELGLEERERVGEMLFRFYYGSLLRHGLASADPHPGNYLLQADGRMAFLDVGLVAEFPETVRELYRSSFLALRNEDVDGFFGALVEGGFVRKPRDVDPERVFEWARFSLAPIATDAEFTFSRDWIAELTTASMDPRSEWFSLLRKMNVPGWAIAQQRLDLGVYSVLAQLGATRNWHRICGEYYGLWGPTTELGEAEAAWLAARAP